MASNQKLYNSKNYLPNRNPMSKYGYLISIVALCSIMGIPQASAIEQDQLDVRMIYLTKIEQGSNWGFLLSVSSMNQKHPMKINWTGIHLDWQPKDVFFKNTTKFDLVSRQSVSIGLSIDCPRGTPLGKHSDYIMIEYLVQDGPNSTWNSHYWISQESEDFEVIPPTIKPSGPDPILSWLNANFCILGIVITIVVLAVLGIMTIKEVKRKMNAGVPQSGGPSLQPGINEPGVLYPSGLTEKTSQGPGTPYQKPVHSATKTCPYCGSVATGGLCASCGRMLWE